MPGEPRVYEVRVHGCATVEEAIALQEPIARLLCPEEHHTGPCEVPWGFSLEDAEDDAERAAEVVERVRALVGEARPVTWGAGDDPERFEELVEQHRVEHAPREPRGEPREP